MLKNQTVQLSGDICWTLETGICNVRGTASSDVGYSIGWEISGLQPPTHNG